MQRWVKPLGLEKPDAMICQVCRRFEPITKLNKHVCTGGGMDKVFVYGSLRKGQHNHDVLTSLAPTFLKDDQIEAIKLSTRYSFPAIQEGLGLVDGELYELDREGLLWLDHFEGHPTFYQRREVTTKSGEKAWAYFGTGVIDQPAKEEMV